TRWRFHPASPMFVGLLVRETPISTPELILSKSSADIATQRCEYASKSTRGSNGNCESSKVSVMLVLAQKFVSRTLVTESPLFDWKWTSLLSIDITKSPPTVPSVSGTKKRL